MTEGEGRPTLCVAEEMQMPSHEYARRSNQAMKWIAVMGIGLFEVVWVAAGLGWL
jgi:hypothetical protein